MAQLLNSLHRPLFLNNPSSLFLNNPSSRDSPSNALTSLQHHLFISRGNYAGFQKCRGVQSSSQGNWEVLDHVEKCPLQCEANVSKGGELEVLPHIQTLRKYPEEDLSGKVVLVRFDSTILLQEQLDAKARSVSNALFTITYLYEAGAKVILVSDWSSKIDSKLLAADFVSDFLSSVLKLKVVPARCISVYVLSKMDEFKKADILLLKNLSEFKEELANCSKFAEKLSSGVDIFVNDSFSQSHKVLASTVGIARFCYASVAGFHFEEGLYQLNKAAKTDGLPYVAIVGGGNLYEKAAALQFLTSRCNGLVFVGMMAFQIMHALGLPVPLNLVERGALKEALNLIQLAQYKKIPLLYPKDFWCMNISLQKQLQIFPAHGILDGWVPVDLGPSSLDEISSLLTKCKAYLFEIDWHATFCDPAQPLVVDIGSGNGLFLLGMAKRRKDLNFLGLEINEKLVRRCLDSIRQSGIKNVYFVATNATSTFRSIVSSYPGELILVSILCPNPDFNKPEYRWRILQRSLVEAVVDLLESDGKVFLQSDIEEVAVRMKEQFVEYGKGKLAIVHGQDDAISGRGGWLMENPFGIRSDWEQHVIDRGAPMYGLMLSKSVRTE